MYQLDAATREQHDDVYRLIMAGWGSQVIRALASLQVAEQLEAASLTADQLAERLSSEPRMTYRLLRAAAALGLLDYDAPTGQFTGTPLLAILHGDSPMSLKHYAQAAPENAFWLPSLRLAETVQCGHNHAEEMLGCTPFQYLAEHQAEGETFRAAMTELSTPVIREAVAKMDIGDVRTVVDVGGANGAFLAELLRHHPHVAGVVLDIPQAMAGIAEEARRCGVEDQMTGVAGDFFHEVPAGDLYLLKFVLHDWDDQACQTILANIRRAMNPGARLIVVEMAVDEASPEATLMDVAMLFAFTGQEREEAHLHALLASSGMRLFCTERLHKPYLMMEAVAT
ncbi:MAG: methyltransferase [Mycobacterium sp.]